MTFEEVNIILGDDALGCDGYGCKLIREKDKVFMVSISSDDGGVGVEEIEDTEENWERIQSAFDDMKPFGKNGRYAIKDAIDKHSTHIISTAFWG